MFLEAAAEACPGKRQTRPAVTAVQPVADADTNTPPPLPTPICTPRPGGSCCDGGKRSYVISATNCENRDRPACRRGQDRQGAQFLERCADAAQQGVGDGQVT